MGDETSSTDLFHRVRFTGEPVANPASVVRSGDVRFTVLTSRLIRLEWSETGAFEDRGTYAFPTRLAEAPSFETRIDGDDLVIDTGALVLRYERDGGAFSGDNLSIALAVGGQRVTWVPGMRDPLNLRGTRRTVDECAGDAALEEGILSRSGWALHDDSRAVVFSPDDGWVAPRPDYPIQDWYFFGYGHDYKGALREYTQFGCGVPLIPRYVLGLWWSRYWAYSDADLRNLVGEFETHGVPLDVLVIDMDWHLPDTWTGYTWDRALFPDPAGFLDWVHAKGLRATFNLHPAQGVQSHEGMYTEFAEAMGVDPSSGEAVPFRISDKRFVRHYFESLHHPMEEQGVDFWWVDWQQGEAAEMKGLDPLPWLNHLHFRDSVRRGRRAMLYSRWGGLGNHRYHIGFSGDSYVVWTALQFQPYLTAAASNVAFGWWSHDVGGHMGGATEPELYARWMQFGALSPVLRLHSTKDSRAERRPWAYRDDVYRVAKRAIELRYRLLPYTYTMARVASDTGVSLCRPMYFECPDDDAAYAARYQYFFGDQMIAAPFVFPADPETGMATIDVWVPEGTWIDCATKQTFLGPAWVRIVGDLERIPMLVRSGAIFPLAAGFDDQPAPRLTSGTTDAIRDDALVLSVFPGAEGRFRLYEDDGATEAYRAGQFEWTEIHSHMADPATWTVHVQPVEGRCDVLPEARSYEIRLEGSAKPDRVTVDGVPTADWRYDAAGIVTVIPVSSREKDRMLTVTASAERGMSVLGESINRPLVAADVKRLLGDRCPAEPYDVESVLRVSGPGRLDAIARVGGPFVRFIDFVTPEETSQALGRAIVGAPVAVSDPYDVRAVFTLCRPIGDEKRVVRRTKLTKPLVLDVPFSYAGEAQPLHWEAAVEITWRGEVLIYRHTSAPLFPTVYAWRCLVCREGEEPAGLLVPSGDVGESGRASGWRIHRQHTDSLRGSLREPFVVNLRDELAALGDASDSLVAYLTTTILAPEERDAVIRFYSRGEGLLYLDGAEVDEPLGETPDTDPAPFYQSTRTSDVVRLRGGENQLVARVKPSSGWSGPSWRFGAAFATPDGRVMSDLICDPD